jgi:hypothetical protein
MVRRLTLSIVLFGVVYVFDVELELYVLDAASLYFLVAKYYYIL